MSSTETTPPCIDHHTAFLDDITRLVCDKEQSDETRCRSMLERVLKEQHRLEMLAEREESPLPEWWLSGRAAVRVVKIVEKFLNEEFLKSSSRSWLCRWLQGCDDE